MKPLAKAIRASTGLTVREFCETHLESNWVSFSVRVKKNRLYPNEYLYICLVTGKKFEEIFADSFTGSVLMRGEPELTKKLTKLLDQSDGWDKLTKLLSDPFAKTLAALASMTPPHSKPEPNEKNEAVFEVDGQKFIYDKKEVDAAEKFRDELEKPFKHPIIPDIQVEAHLAHKAKSKAPEPPPPPPDEPTPYEETY